MWGLPFVEGMMAELPRWILGAFQKCMANFFHSSLRVSLDLAFALHFVLVCVKKYLLYFFLDSAGGGFSNMPNIINHRNMHQFLWWSIHVSPGSHPLVVLVPLKSGKSIEGKALHGQTPLNVIYYRSYAHVILLVVWKVSNIYSCSISYSYIYGIILQDG